MGDFVPTMITNEYLLPRAVVERFSHVLKSINYSYQTIIVSAVPAVDMATGLDRTAVSEALQHGFS